MSDFNDPYLYTNSFFNVYIIHISISFDHFFYSNIIIVFIKFTWSNNTHMYLKYPVIGDQGKYLYIYLDVGKSCIFLQFLYKKINNDATIGV